MEINENKLDKSSSSFSICTLRKFQHLLFLEQEIHEIYIFNPVVQEN